MAFKTDFDDAARFFRAWMDRPMFMGAIAPSGPALSAVVAKQVDPQCLGPIIELGPGTGAVTDALLDRGIAPERLVLIEFNRAFCDLLAQRFPATTIVQGDAYDIESRLKFLNLPLAGAIVSGLPLYSRPVAERLKLLRQAFKHMAYGAPFIQFTYATHSPIPLDDDHIEAQVLPQIWLNLPPARVWIYREKR